MIHLDSWVLERLVCPRDKLPLTIESDKLICAGGHCYPVVDGIPILLLDDVPQTHPEAKESLLKAAGKKTTIYNLSEPVGDSVDPFVQEIIAATSGVMYRPLIGKMKGYPIPEIQLPFGDGKYLLDIGCNWGRWSVAAYRAGYKPVGIDPSLEAVRSAKRVAKQLNVEPQFIVGDGRYLPFKNDAFDVVFSYGVLQHFSKDDVRTALKEVARVLQENGTSLIQLPNKFGARMLSHQIMEGFVEPRKFETRFWTPKELRRDFTEAIGPSKLFIDGFFCLNPQLSETKYLPFRFKMVVHLSDFLRKLGNNFNFMLNVADSIYIESIKAPQD